MAAANTDKIRKGTSGFSATLTASISNSDATIALSNVNNLATDTAVELTIDRVDSSGVSTPTKREVIIGVVSGLNIVTCLRGQDNTTAQSHSTGAVVECIPTGKWSSDLGTAILQDHTQQGYHNKLSDANGVAAVTIGTTASAVNGITITDAATGNAPVISATGTDSNIDLKLTPKGTGKVYVDGSAPRSFFALYDFIESGCVWSGDAYASTRNASMTAGVVWIGGKRLTVAAVTARSFTASKDVYVDLLDNGDGTAIPVYTDNVTNAASPALAANSVRLAIIVVGATNIAAATSVNQGQETMVVPIASSIPYAVTDSLGNLICPRDPNRKILGYRQLTSAFTNTTIGAYTDITGLNFVINVPTGRKVRFTFIPGQYISSSGVAGSFVESSIYDATGAVEIGNNGFSSAAASYAQSPNCSVVNTPTAGARNYKMRFKMNNAGTYTLNAQATTPAIFMAELI